eukprot:1155773-Pelagomonas_calceolata.AAC.2
MEQLRPEQVAGRPQPKQPGPEPAAGKAEAVQALASPAWLQLIILKSERIMQALLTIIFCAPSLCISCIKRNEAKKGEQGNFWVELTSTLEDKLVV